MSVTIATGVVTVQPDINTGGVNATANRAGQQAGDAFVRGMDGRLRDGNGRFVRALNQTGDTFTTTGNRANRFSMNMRGLGGTFATVGRAVLAAGGTFAKFGMAAGAAIPAVAGLVAALQNMAPVAAGAVTAAFAFGSAMAAIKIGTAGIGEALTEAFKPAAPAAAAASNAAKQHAQAMEQVERATESAARANVDAADAVKDAMQGVKDAVKSAADANSEAARRVKDSEDDLRVAQQYALSVQKDLTQARKDAGEELEDLNSRLANSELDLKGAALDVKDAEERLREVQAKGSKATALEKAEAQLALDRAKQRLKDQVTETTRLREETKAANDAGISGTQSMTQWREKMKGANDGIASQEQSLADARKEQSATALDGQRSIADAEKSLADARKNQAQTAADGQRAIADAMQALTDVTENSATPAVNKFAEAMAGLAPNARAFVNQIIALKPAWDNLQMSVQNKLFEGFASQIKLTSDSVLPVLKTSLTETAGILNQMGLGAMQAAAKLGKDGTLGLALKGANEGLGRMKDLPGKIITALTQIGVAGAGPFNALTQSISDSVSRITDRIGEMYQTGELTATVETAMAIVKDFGAVLGNVFEIFGNIFGQFQEAGGGIINVLLTITDALVEFTAAKGFQDAILALAEVFAMFAETAAPLLGEVLEALAPILTTLGPPIQILIHALGKALTPIIEALAPILAIAAEAVGNLIEAFAPILPVIGELIASLLPPLVPLFEVIASTFAKFGPLVRLVGEMLTSLLAPILKQLGPILEPIINHFALMADEMFPLLMQLLLELAPSIASIGESFGELLIALTPLIVVMTRLMGEALVKMLPMLTPIIELVGKFAAILADQLSSAITNVLMPAINTMIALFNGDFKGAWEGLKSTVSGVWEYIEDTFNSLKTIVSDTIDAIVEIFEYLYDVLIGHSIIPDLVKGIVDYFVNLRNKGAEAMGKMMDWVVTRIRDLRDKVISAISWTKTKVVEHFTSLRDKITTKAAEARDWVTTRARTLRDNVVSAFNSMKEKAITAFNKTKEGIALVWNKLKEVAAKPVNFVINSVYNNGIRKFWNSIAGKVGLNNLPELKTLKFQKGGTVDLREGAHLPGYSRTDDTLAMVRSGEGVLVPEAVRALGGAGFINRANRMKGGAGRLVGGNNNGKIPGFAFGGIVDAVGGFISKGKDMFKEGFSKALGAVTGPIVNAMKEKFGSKPLLGMPTLIVAELAKKIKGFLGPMGGKLEGGNGGKVVQTARSQTGYYGRPNKFTQAPGMWTDEWCGMFVDWVFKKANAYKALSPVKGTPAVRSYTSLQKVGKSSMRAGDLALYRGDTGHINIVTDPKTKETVGGNESNNEVKKSLGYVNSASSIRRPKGFASGGIVEAREVLRAGGLDNLRSIAWQDRVESPNPGSSAEARRDLFAAPPWVSRDMGGLLPDGMMAYNTSGTAEVVSTLDQLKALVASGKGQTYIFNEGAIQLDASKIKSIQDVVDMIEALKVTSRQFGARR